MPVQVQVLSPALVRTTSPAEIEGLATNWQPDWGDVGVILMASLQLRGDSYRIAFRHDGKQRFVTLGKVSKEEAEAKLGHVENRLLRLKQGLKHLPDGVEVVDYVLH